MKKVLIFILFIIVILCAQLLYSKDKRKEEKMIKLSVTSTAFSESGMIPSLYTCDGEDISPPLTWSEGPEGTKSYALISDDPDAPMGTWVHWVIYNIPESVTSLPENIPTSAELKDGSQQGINDFKRHGYGGPCPPGGTHRYYFKVYALNTTIQEVPGLSKKKLLKAMEGHILVQGGLMGKYSR